MKIAGTIKNLTLCFSGLLVLVVALGCVSTTYQKLDEKKFYKRDMIVRINGKKFIGVGVPKKADVYHISVETPGVISNISFRSCHRDDIYTPEQGFFKKKTTFKYTYKPTPLEQGKACLLDIGSYEDRKEERHSWATIDFDSEIENLPAIVHCDGKVYDTNVDGLSTSICQGRIGSLQQIVFDHPVLVDRQRLSRKECDVMRSKDALTYRFKIAEGVSECTYYFGDKYHNFHRMTVLGFGTVLLRGSDYSEKVD